MKSLKLNMIVICFLFSNAIFANSVNVTISPKNPIKGETFNLIFKIQTNSNEDPYISFQNNIGEVQGRTNQGTSISTTIINNRITTKREITYVYEVLANRSGLLRISKINIDLGGKNIRGKSISTKVLSEAQKAKDVFVLAIPSKTSVYIGEGIDVNYYLYFSIPVVASEVKQFPKLNKFLKRFHKVEENPESVEYQGTIYRRVLSYSARVYPESVGNAYIDPLRLKVQYAARRRRNNSPFGGLGLSFREYRNKSVSSKKIKIEVKPIPSINVPPDFTGLVGRHDFKLQIAKNKFLVNEAIEFKLEVVGGGALENFDAPNIYSNKKLENFDTKSEVEVLNKGIARKLFDYTYLARGKLNIENRQLSFSYFDSDTKEFKQVFVEVPPLIIGGGAARVATGGNQYIDKSNTSEKTSTSLNGLLSGAIAPDFKVSPSDKINIKLINLFLSILFILILISTFIGKTNIFERGNTDVKILCKNLKNNGAEYSTLHKLLINLKKSGQKDSDISLPLLINEATLSLDAKTYFKNLLILSERVSFNNEDINSDFKYNKRYFDELKLSIENNSRVI